MKRRKLTGPRTDVTSPLMRGGDALVRWSGQAGMGGLAAILLAGCINVQAPDEPIVIELNINIRQEVIYRLAEDANETIEDNADIF